MISFTVKPNGTINVKPKGNIQYCFKGKTMHPERATVVMQEGNILTVNRDSDDRLFDFVKKETHWLLKNNASNNSPLFGTRFVFDE